MNRVCWVSIFATAALALAGCPDDGDGDGDNGEPVVQVSIDKYVLNVGDTATVTATTVNAEDPSYEFTSSDPAVATVDAASGAVTAVAAGEASITAKGATTGESASVGIVVLEEGFDPNQTPNYTAWASSGHADRTSEAFIHWDEDGEVPASCAKCHSTPGYLDFLGADGSPAGAVDKPAAVGTTVECGACHNPVASNLTSVKYPSGVTVTENLERSARCEVCHQGRESTVSVNKVLGIGVDGGTPLPPDTVATNLTFRNVHYFAAGATMNAGVTQGGYQYEGKMYDVRFQHAGELDTCSECHDAHSLAIDANVCAGCHSGAAADTLHNIRMIESRAVDYDGDGDTNEGIYGEIDTLKTALLAQIQSYAGTTPGTSKICFGELNHPYWFVDTDGDGQCSMAEAVSANAYKVFTPKLLQATYNYQFAKKDPGGYAHNGKYVIQLLFDSIESLGGDVTGKARDDVGHFQGASEAFRHWDEEGNVPASCSKCHGGAEGFHFFVEHAAGTEVPASQNNGLQCETCHTDAQSFGILDIKSVTFPSGVTVNETQLPEASSRVCATCHQGREAKATIDAAIARNTLGFRNVHYLPSAATLLGSVAKVGYEYTGKTYNAKWSHTGGTDCAGCHKPGASNHSFQVADVFSTACKGCHQTDNAPADVRVTLTADYDGDGDTTEPLAAEIDGMGEKVLAAMAATTGGGAGAICYNGDAYPYFFKKDGSGGCDTTQRFTGWTAALMKAAHNYQFTHKDPGSWAHNFKYAGQLLFDSVEDLGGSTTGMTRP